MTALGTLKYLGFALMPKVTKPRSLPGSKTLRVQRVNEDNGVVLGLYSDNGKENGNYYNRAILLDLSPGS